MDRKPRKDSSSLNVVRYELEDLLFLKEDSSKCKDLDLLQLLKHEIIILQKYTS